MKKRHTEEQIIGVLKEHEAGIPIAELCRKHGLQADAAQSGMVDAASRRHAALDAKVKEGAIRPKEGVSLADFYESVMKGYTYLGGPQAAEPGE